jgi:capsular polysaccharide biosynthesis protein
MRAALTPPTLCRHPQSAGVIEDVLVNHEALVFRRGRIYRESFPLELYAAPYKRARTYSRFFVKNYWLRRGAIKLESGLWVIDTLSADSYFHWLIDCLPRILRAEELYPHERSLLLPRGFRRHRYVSFTLAAFPNIDRIGWIGTRSKARVMQLAFVPVWPPFAYPPRDLAEVARRVGALAGRAGAARRIYFSRADARRRRARNEHDVLRLLRAHDFEICQIDLAKPWEQVRVSLGARLMVGVHGAALANVIFMAAGGQLLELRHGRGDVFLDAYRPLAEAVGVDYRRQLCEPAPVESPFPAFDHERVAAQLRPAGDPLYKLNDMDIVVDLDLLRENLRDAPD